MFFEQGGGPLNSVADVLIDAITDKEIIQYDAASGKHINRTLVEAGIGATVHVHDTADITTGTLADTLVAESNVTQHVAAIDHDSTLNFVAGEHFLQSAISITESQVSDLKSYLLDTTDTFTGILGVVGSINNAPGSDIDTNLMTIGVTGTPTFSWDESEDAFDFNKGLRVTGNLDVIGTAGVGLARTDGTLHAHTASAGSVTAHANADEGVFENSGAAGISILGSNASDLSIRFGSPVSNNSGLILWNYDASLFTLGPNKVGSGLRFQSGGFVEAMRLDSSQDVLIGLTSGNDGKLHIDQASTTGAKPVLHLDQVDLSEEFIKFSSTIGTGNPIEAVAAKTMTPTHFLRVELEGGLVRYINAGTIA